MGRLILASGSPRRLEIMRRGGYDPEVMPVDVDESLPYICGMRDTVLFLALKKARAAEKRILAEAPARVDAEAAPTFPAASAPSAVPVSPAKPTPTLILAADTIVFCRGEIMGKPKDRGDAWRMLTALRGDVHQVATGVALVQAGLTGARTFCEVTRVYVRPFSDEALAAYLDTGEPYDKAGGYAIQGAFGPYIDRIEGDYDNVVGLPWPRVAAELLALGYPPGPAAIFHEKGDRHK